MWLDLIRGGALGDKEQVRPRCGMEEPGSLPPGTELGWKAAGGGRDGKGGTKLQELVPYPLSAPSPPPTQDEP